MITYAVCDQDGFISLSTEGDIAHYAANPTHTSHVGVGGNSASPIPYTGSSTISQVATDPVSPTPGQIWVLATGQVGTAGQAMGVLGLTYSRQEVQTYQLSYATSNGDIRRVPLS